MVGVPYNCIFPSGRVNGHSCACAHVQLHVLRCTKEHRVHIAVKVKGLSVLHLLLRVSRVLALVKVAQPCDGWPQYEVGDILY